MVNPAIRVEHVSKCFRIAKEPCYSLKEFAIRALQGGLSRTEFYALDDVTFTITKGESVALLGANGSGKSTLFRILSSVLKPTKGTVEVFGRVSPLIELAAGFHPDLTGIENIDLNAAIFGLSAQETQKKLMAIREFADIGDFIYSPVRVYSSGMLTRLSFGLAIHVDADILLIDEVLTVGDADFQERCLERLVELKKDGITVVLVSHDLSVVRRMADRVLLLENGRLVGDGQPDDLIRDYLARNTLTS